MKGTVKLSLDKESPCEAHAEIDTVKVTIRAGSTDISISGDLSSNHEEAVAKAIKLSEQFLNTLSWKDQVYLEVKTDSYSIEGDEGLEIGLPTLKITCQVNPPTVILGDVIIDFASKGIVVTNDSRAATYYRHAHLANHPFITFENLYKTVADRIKSKIGFTETSLKNKYFSNSYEKSLFQLSLEECFNDNIRQLEQIINGIPSIQIQNKSHIFKELSSLIYDEYRCPIAHSKTGKKTFDPNNEIDKKAVQAILPLMDFIALQLLKFEETKYL